MIKAVAWGMKDDGTGFYVKQICDAEHKGQKCSCKMLFDNIQLDVDAKKLAEKKAKELNVQYGELM